MDWGVVFGLAGFGVGLVSLIYARTQAVHARRQADAAHLVTTLELQRTMSERIYQGRMDLVRNPGTARMYLDANPILREIYPDVAAMEAIVPLRNLIDGLQDMYFLRKEGIVGDHHWRNWMAAFGPIATMPIARQIFDNAIARQALEPEFIEFLRPMFEGKPLGDPKPAR